MKGLAADDARTATYWLRRAIRVRQGVGRYPEDKDTLENLAQTYERMAEQLIRIENLRHVERWRLL
jgi:hypothetical protein